MKIRSFQPGDENSLVDLWNRTLLADPITAKRFRNKVLLDANFDPRGLLVAFMEEQLVGAAYVVRRRLPLWGDDLEFGSGWLSFFFVDERKEREGVGSALLEGCEAFATSVGITKLYFSSYAPNYFLPGIDKIAYPKGAAFLEKKKFSRLYSPVAMQRLLNTYTYPKEIRQLKEQREIEGYTFSLLTSGELPKVIEFATTHFNPDWGRAIREGILQGFDPEQIHVAKQHGEVVGFAMYGGYEGVRERFGPFGVSESQQGKGLGKILLHDTLFAMRKRTLHSAWFLWTSETSSAGYLYGKNGFETYRTFDVLVKNLQK